MMKDIYKNNDGFFETVKEYIDVYKEDRHRFRSWDYCYAYFNREDLDKDTACLHLAFFLASWGMYRGSSFLLKKDYKYLMPIVETVLSHKNQVIEVNENTDFKVYWTLVNELSTEIKNSFSDDKEKVTDTLITKILLGTYGLTPAYDRFFIKGLRAKGITPTYFGEKSLRSIFDVIKKHADDIKRFQDFQVKEMLMATPYPPMKMIDMYFWQIGVDKKTST